MKRVRYLMALANIEYAFQVRNAAVMSCDIAVPGTGVSGVWGLSWTVPSPLALSALEERGRG